MNKKLLLNPLFKKTFHCIVLVNLMFLSHYSTAQWYVEEHGQLKVAGNKIVDQKNNPIQLRGMSLYWSQWNSDTLMKKNKFYTEGTVKWLRDDWNCNVIRAAMGVEDTLGYAVDSLQENQVTTVVDAAIQHGIYVIIDYHSHLAHENIALAKKFFAKMAKKYAGYPHVIYETYNEPRTEDWGTVKDYHTEIIEVIRQYDKKNLIICGTPFYCQHIDKAANDPIKDSGVVYAVHYYAANHDFKDAIRSALNKGIAVFISEYGTVDYNGKGDPSVSGSQSWWTFLDENKIGNCNWSLHDLPEGASALKLGASPEGGWTDEQLTPSGKLVKAYLTSKKSTDPVTSAGGEVSEKTFSVAPNPFVSSFVIGQEGRFSFELLNGLGKRMTAGEASERCEVSLDLAPGLYTLVVNSEKGIKVTKIIKK